MSTSTAIPSLRTDLEPFVMVEDGRTIIVLADPVSGRHFRLREVEGTLLALLDGRDLEALHRELTAIYPGHQLTMEGVARFVEQAGELGLLHGMRAIEPSRSLLQRLFFLKIPVANPDRLLARCYTHLGFLYRPWALAVALSLVLVAAGVAVTSAEELSRSFVPPTTPAGVALMWASVSLITLIHELGHGLTCKHFGARATGFGLLLVYLLPCFYCDVSGAWTLPRRRQRLWVGLAGLGFQFVAGAIALLVWRVTEPTSLVARIALSMVGVCGLDALLNLLPLIRLDGYYLLSDWLEIPNLRPRALAYVGGRLRGFLLGLSSPPATTTPRQTRILLVYGTLSCLFALAMLSWSGAALYQWLYGRFGGIGAVMAWGFIALPVTLAARHGLDLWLAALRAGETAREGGKKEPSLPVAPSPSRHLAVSPSRRLAVSLLPLSSRTRAIGLAGLVPVAVSALVLGQAPLTVVGPCRLEARRTSPVRVARPGVLSELRYREGDWVPAGATVGLLDTFALQRELASLEARATMLQVETDIARRRVSLVAAELHQSAAGVKAELPRARVAVEEATQVQQYRLAEAADRVAEARAALLAAQNLAARRRADATRSAAGEYPPSLQAHAARVTKAHVESAASAIEVARLASLLDEKAIALRTVELARAQHRSLEQQEAVAQQELLAAAQRLREEADDAEAEVVRRRAVLHAAQHLYRQVERQSQPSRVAAAREVLRVRETAVRATGERAAESDVRRAEIALKRLESARLQSQIALVQDRIGRSRIVAPIAGVVATPRLDQKLGREFSPGESVLTLDDTRQLQVRVYVDEREVADVAPSQTVQVKLGAFPSRLFTGTVDAIARRPLQANSRNSYEVRLTLANPDGQLRPGMTGWAKVACGRRSWAALLSRRVTRFLRTEAWSWF